MHTVKGTLLTLTMIVILAVPSAFAGAPTMMNYQGFLTDGLGDPVADDTYTIEFRIYDGASTELWLESHSVPTVDGLFSVLLGSNGSPLSDDLFADTDCYLGITVGTDLEISPRSRLVAAPYAMRLATIDSASGGTIVSKVSIGTGHANTGTGAFVVGDDHTASGSYATIGGGQSNEVSWDFAVIGGGAQNRAAAPWATVGGGLLNQALGNYSIVAGGANNTAIGGLTGHSTVSGGQYNEASYFATVAGGQNDTASGAYSVVPGGYNNIAGGFYSFAAGRRARIDGAHDGTFVWADHTDADFASTGPDQFLIRASGGVGINENDPQASLHLGGTPGVDGIMFPDGTLQTTAAAGSGGWSDDGDVVRLEAATDSVGIGLSNPSEKLDVDGNIHASGIIDVGGIRMTLGAVDGRVLMTNGSGVASWQDAPDGSWWERIVDKQVQIWYLCHVI